MKHSKSQIINIILGQAIHSLRKRTGKSQEHFGALANTGLNMQSRYEKGKTPIPAAYLFMISQATNTPIMEIIPEDTASKCYYAEKHNLTRD